MPPLMEYPSLLWRLVTIPSSTVPGDGWVKPWNHCKLVIRGMVHGVWNLRWHGFLLTPFMRNIVARHPRLLLKVQVPYINRTYRPAQRLELLETHYRFVQERLSLDLAQRLHFGEAIRLAQWSLPTSGVFSLRLGLTEKYWQEGEMELSLYHEEQQRCMAFVHFSVTGDSEISVGCLQGAKPVDDPFEISNREIFSTFKRDMHGMRHKSLLVFALRSIARCWNITTIKAVSAEAQLWADKLVADYNSFWMEEGGVLVANGMFELPVKVIFEIKARKRTMYQRRYKCLEKLGGEIELSLAHPDHETRTLDFINPDTGLVPNLVVDLHSRSAAA